MNCIFAKISSRENISNSVFAKISSRENKVLYSISFTVVNLLVVHIVFFIVFHL